MNFDFYFSYRRLRVLWRAASGMPVGATASGDAPCRDYDSSKQWTIECRPLSEPELHNEMLEKLEKHPMPWPELKPGSDRDVQMPKSQAQLPPQLSPNNPPSQEKFDET